jgi:hypothetical protein
MPWLVVRKYPTWVYMTIRLFIVVGMGFTAYWLIRRDFYFQGTARAVGGPTAAAERHRSDALRTVMRLASSSVNILVVRFVSTLAINSVNF